jgi:hypothetical protein
MELLQQLSILLWLAEQAVRVLEPMIAGAVVEVQAVF